MKNINLLPFRFKDKFRGSDPLDPSPYNLTWNEKKKKNVTDNI